MKSFLFAAFALCFFSAGAQSKTDSLAAIQNWARWYDLSFTSDQSDSMLSSLQGLTETYREMHKTLPANSMPFPFAFEPAPYGTIIPQNQQKITWDIPANVTLPKNRADLAFYSIPQLASLLKSKKLTSVALTQFFLDRLKKWGDTLQCVITLTEDTELAQAARADADLAKGIYRGPLQGVPYGLKDLFAVKGYRTTWGSTPYMTQVLDNDAYVYTKLRAAGGVLCAKLSMGALAYDNKWFGGETKNPWNLAQGSSGSSAGSAAATAAGLLPYAIGTETLGSIVSPSTRCGATGLRPTFGTVSRSGAMVLCWSLDKTGPICRSAEDAAIVYAAIKGTDGLDASAVAHAFNYTGHGDLKKLRVAYAKNYFDKLPADALERDVLKEFAAMGISPTAVNFPDSGVYNADLVNIVLTAESGAAFDELTRTGRDSLIERQDKDFWPTTFRTSRLIPAVEYINANRYRAELGKTVQTFMNNYDVVIVPTFAGNQLSITNLTGNPVICMPMGFAKDGTPRSISFVGRLYDEASIVEAAKAYQEHTGFDEKHPPKFSN